MPLKKLEDMVIYKNDDWYSTFPSLATRPDGTLLCAFRRAPDRRKWGGSATHADPNSWCMMVRSEDDGRSWTVQPEVICANPLAGNQDPGLFQLESGTLLCSTFSWMLLSEAVKDQPGVLGAGMGWLMCNIGASVVRSTDGGDTWEGPYVIDPPPDKPTEKFAGVPNRGACRGKMTQLPDGRVLWPLYSFRESAPADSCIYVSADEGLTWEYYSLIAEHDEVELNETSLQLCPSGKIMAWMRTDHLDGYLAVAHSTDEGKTWSQWEKSSIWGHPFTSCEIPDGRVALIYGHRREPFGIRMKLLEPECTDYDAAEELVLRTDGGNHDIGYPWVTMLSDGNILCAYYMNHEDGVRHIAGSIVAVE